MGEKVNDVLIRRLEGACEETQIARNARPLLIRWPLNASVMVSRKLRISMGGGVPENGYIV